MGYTTAGPPSSSSGHAAEGTNVAPGGQSGYGTHMLTAAGGDPFQSAVEAEPALMGLLAANLDDLESTRIAAENRLRQATRSVADSDGETRGLGLDARNPYVQQTSAILEQVKGAEHQAALSLKRAMRRHPLGPWVKDQRGLGEKQVARLLAAVGDPYIRPALIVDADPKAVKAGELPGFAVVDGAVVELPRPRMVSELWALCGFHVLPARHVSNGTHVSNAGGNQTGHPGQPASETHDCFAGVAPKRQRGQRVNWSPEAKMRTFLIAESVVKQLSKTCPVDEVTRAAAHVEGCACSPFRKVYDRGRVKYADAVHRAPCVRCGPKGAPAPAGTPLSASHKMARAVRLTCKEILKEMWRESRRLHGVDTPPPAP